MAVSLRTDIIASKAIRGLNRSQNSLSTIFERLSSGQRINKASDDAAGLAVASSLNFEARVTNQGMKNINDGISAISIASNAISTLSDITIRRQELAEQSANGVYSTEQRKCLNEEFKQLGKEYQRIFESIEFNGINLLNGGLNDLSLQLGKDKLSIDLEGAFEKIFNIKNAEIGINEDEETSYDVTKKSGGYPVQVALADLNGDGVLDAVTTDYGTPEQCDTESGYSNTVSVSLGNGDGTFKSATFYELGTATRPNSLSIADINNDDVLDLVVQTARDDLVYSLTGVGDGTFNTPTTFDSKLSVLSAIASGDINGDGNVDVISTGRKVGTSGYYTYVNLGDGLGGFTENLTGSKIGGISYNMEVADLNGDGKDDVITANRSDKSVSVLMSNGTSTLSTAITYSENDAVYDVTTGDIDGDSVLDMVVATGNNVSVYKGAGDGTFTKLHTYEGGNGVTSVALGDINNDGSLDIFSTAGGDGQISVFLGNGDGSFQERDTYDTGRGPMSIAVGDLNNDGKADAITANSKDGTMTSGTSGLVTLSVSSQENALSALEKLSKTLSNISATLGELGGIESRLDVVLNVMQTSKENYLSAKSTIMDTNIAETSANLVRQNILQNISSSIIAQANNQSQIALKLLSFN